MGINDKGEVKNKPPELIIQDELHLISDALGSIVGVYETGFDTALIQLDSRVKYIASTATIKNAVKQVKNLYGRDCHIFPPVGLRYDDSFFAKTVPLKEKPGRLYVGYLAPKPNRQNCLIALAGSLLAARTHLYKDDEIHIDNWWTQLIYHGSLKGLSNSASLYTNQIMDRFKRLTLENLRKEIENEQPNFCEGKELNYLEDFEKIKDPAPEEIRKIIKKYLPIIELNKQELSSKRSAEENVSIFNQLTKQQHEPDHIDIALATNMVATGLDVSRLALMVINGQPLTTAEYIQASSRVGRGEVPGIVFSNYYKTQARSLSHYENFRAYHDVFYRFVEPLSVTPFTYQARKRALHAALIVAMRFSNIGLLDKADKFDKDDDKVKKVVNEFKTRCHKAIDSEEVKKAVDENIDKLVKQWHNYATKTNRNLDYHTNDRGSDNLMRHFGQDNGKWQTFKFNA